MANLLPSIPSPQGFVYRVARRRNNPFDPPSWEYVHEDGTFGGRFDDPGKRWGITQENRFRMIYCATQCSWAYGETIAGLRPKLSAIAGLKEIEHSPPDSDLTIREILDDWRSQRWIGRIKLHPSLRFADIEAAEVLHVLRSSPEIAHVALELGLTDIDRSTLYGPHRLVTQSIARFVYEQFDDTGKPIFAGLRYISRLNAEWECWAIFDNRASQLSSFTEDILPDDPGLLEVATFFHLDI